ncbi:hypothetical protein [Streptomyces sp. MMG1121]|uniref:hypothetical protein n=1 Tax=Streptomyces sp. MMG1121 TaxID=1415544 RepID=UPI0006AE8D12|nr:hypothetical protein [Streptomyces sp. MMG1121]KOV68711.1 hypothetical protein ADK64_06750 [Streptomyces sp. MMG1121]
MSDEPIWDEWAHRVYLTWLAREIRYAQVSLAEVYEQASRTPPPQGTWISLETFLMFTAKVSKTLSPLLTDKPRTSKGQTHEGWEWRQVRGSYLRNLLGVDDTSPVLDPKVRDASEHFDERLDEWVAHQPRPSADPIEAGDLPDFPSVPMRQVDQELWVVEIAGEELDLKAIEIELRRILARVTELEPLATVEDPGLATLLARLPPFPPELGLDAPTRRPDEDVRTRTDREPAAVHQREPNETTVPRVADALAPAQETDEQGPDAPEAD